LLPVSTPPALSVSNLLTSEAQIRLWPLNHLSVELNDNKS